MDIIDSFDKLPIGRYMDIQEVSKDDSLEEVDRMVKIISILTGASEEDILHLPIAEFTELSSRANFLTAEGFRARPIAKKYIVGKWDLIPVTDYRKLETCQYIDFKTYAQDMDANMVGMLSVLLVPKGHRYNEGYDILEVQQAIREEMSVADGAMVVGFFLTLLGKSIKDILRFSKREAMKIPDKAKREEMLKRIEEQEEALRTSGDGSPA